MTGASGLTTCNLNRGIFASCVGRLKSTLLGIYRRPEKWYMDVPFTKPSLPRKASCPGDAIYSVNLIPGYALLKRISHIKRLAVLLDIVHPDHIDACHYRQRCSGAGRTHQLTVFFNITN